MTCTFFGHRIVPKEIEPTLRLALIELIQNHDVNSFYVGNQGGFDSMVHRLLKDLNKEYNIQYQIVLAYMPKQTETTSDIDFLHTLLPHDIEYVPKRFAIFYRNKWMIEHSDYVITYVVNRIGSGAAQFKELSERRGKIVINITD